MYSIPMWFCLPLFNIYISSGTVVVFVESAAGAEGRLMSASFTVERQHVCVRGLLCPMQTFENIIFNSHNQQIEKDCISDH